MARRRSRLVIACTVIILFMLYRVAQNSWDEPAGYESLRAPIQPQVKDESSLPTEPADEQQDTAVERPQALPEGESPPEVAVEGFTKIEMPEQKPEKEEQDENTESEKVEQETTTEAAEEKPAEPELKAKEPPMNDLNDEPRKKASDEEHWEKQTEHFPVASENLTQLPSGAPKALPRIQFDFGAESIEAKKVREDRLQTVKDAIKRTWDGYRKHAWMHDELQPVSAKFRDPFCGWAATLVDSLDTLWISGLKEEFDEAAKAVKDIDFTYTERSKIPVFETVIRYLGGLLSAYDVSGGEKGNYKVLLDKAVELAEILMSVFDTPNRMPILHYNWHPMMASQPRRAGHGNIAELATLSMEFTRLAQLTGSAKYYDAINRITDALVDMQEQNGTAIAGLFPENIDLTGCEKIPKTDPSSLSKAAQEQLGAEDALDGPQGWNAEGDVITPVGHAALDEAPAEPQDTRWSDPPELAKRSSLIQRRSPPSPLAAGGEGIDWDCKPKAVAGGRSQSFSMSGCQDSAYEYFPKEYMLLGGLESKYQKLHEDTIAAIDEWLLFRPMIKDDDKWDILFPSKVETDSDLDSDVYHSYEVTHLACFLGGMYGLGAKLFNREKDLETAKKLTDGCVWAYQSTPSGLMPETSRLLPCPGLEKCEFNETLWYDKLDRNGGWRDVEAKKWDAEHAERKAAEQAALEAKEKGETIRPAASEEDEAAGEVLKQKAEEVEVKVGSVIDDKAAAEALQKKAEEVEETLSEAGEAVGDVADEVAGEALKQKAEEAEASNAPVKRDMPKGVPKLAVPKKALPEEPRVYGEDESRPKTHMEYVQEMIEEEGYPPGMTEIPSAVYILRPEAIESVWYMYRITGDPTWQEKGWTMFEATMNATRTDFAYSAIRNVMHKTPHLTDEMESFWLAETLKYYYLLFSEPDVISLDEWVLNTEAHPFKRPMAAASASG